MNLNGIQRLYGLMRRKCLDNKFQVLTYIQFGIQWYLILCNTTFCYISRSGHCDVLQEILVFKIWQKDQSRIFRNVRGCSIFQGFVRVNGQFFETTFADIFRNMQFLQCNSTYSVQETASEKCTRSVGGFFRNFL